MVKWSQNLYNKLINQSIISDDVCKSETGQWYNKHASYDGLKFVACKVLPQKKKKNSTHWN